MKGLAGQGCDEGLEFRVREERKIVEVWLTQAEKKNRELREGLKPLFEKYSEVQYTVVVFESGEEDLANCTSELLRYNRRRTEELKIGKENHPDTERPIRLKSGAG